MEIFNCLETLENNQLTREDIRQLKQVRRQYFEIILFFLNQV